MAVNRASDLGIAMVIANGNDGPDVWSIGAPATATNALSVGATTHERKVPSLDIGVNEDDIPLAEMRSEEHTSELQSRGHLVCRLLLEKKKKRTVHITPIETASKYIP